MLLIDNLRYDQWKVIEDKILEKFKVIDDDIYMSILPTSTQYSRNSIFSGLKPSEIASKFPDKWLNDEDEGGKNMFEEDFLNDQLIRNQMNDRTEMLAGVSHDLRTPLTRIKPVSYTHLTLPTNREV
mgnify:CR=1 FL=1